MFIACAVTGAVLLICGLTTYLRFFGIDADPQRLLRL